jgi:signal transduction histidine kinase
MSTMRFDKRSSLASKFSTLVFGKRFSLAAKFNLLTITLILVTSVGTCLFMTRLEMANYYQELLNHGKIIADTTAKNCEFGIYTENEALLLPVLESLAADSEIAYVSILNRQYSVLASRIFNGMDGLPMHSIPVTDGSMAVLHRELTDERDGRRYIEILCPLVSGDRSDVWDAVSGNESTAPEPSVVGYVRLGLTQVGLQRRIRQMLISITAFTSVLVLIGTGLTLLLTRKITSPLGRLMKATQDIAEGKFDIPFKTRTNDEIADLARSFDHMRDRLGAYHAQAEERIAEEQRHLMEKEKLMMELHDGIGGITTNISILCELAQKTTDIEDIKKTLATISQLSREGVSEIRSFMQSLDSRELSWHALAVELRNQGTTLVEPHHIQFTAEISIEDVPEQPGSLFWVNLIKIYKESLTNVIKHSKAGSVTITLSVGCQKFFLAVQDDGIGCGEQKNYGRGLPSMKKRAQELGGTLTVSSLEKGMRISLEIPLPIKYPIPRAE